MTINTNALLAQAKQAGEGVDQTVVPSFERSLPAEGYTTARFISYIEVGKQPQRDYQGQKKPDALNGMISFELNGPKQIVEYVDAEGNKKTRTNISRQTMAVKFGDKAKFAKLMKKMVAGRQGITHMAEMLGEAFLIKVVHNKSEDGKKTYANINHDGEWLVGAPSTTDPISNETTLLDVAEPTHPLALLLWETPTKEQWDSIFIDGTYTKKNKDTDQEEEVSKNWIQELCLSASNFVGSPLEGVLGGSDAIIAAMSQEPADEAPTEDAAPSEEADTLEKAKARKAEKDAAALAAAQKKADEAAAAVNEPKDDPVKAADEPTEEPSAVSPADILADLGIDA